MAKKAKLSKVALSRADIRRLYELMLKHKNIERFQVRSIRGSGIGTALEVRGCKAPPWSFKYDQAHLIENITDYDSW